MGHVTNKSAKAMLAPVDRRWSLGVSYNQIVNLHDRAWNAIDQTCSTRTQAIFGLLACTLSTIGAITTSLITENLIVRWTTIPIATVLASGFCLCASKRIFR